MVAIAIEKRYVSAEDLHPDLLYILQRLEEDTLITSYETRVRRKRDPIILYDEKTVDNIARAFGYKRKIKRTKGIAGVSGKTLDYEVTNLGELVDALGEELRRIDEGDERRSDLLEIAKIEINDRTDYANTCSNLTSDASLRKRIVEAAKAYVKSKDGRCSVDMVFDEVKKVAPVTYAAVYSMATLMIANYKRIKQSIPKRETQAPEGG